MITFRISPHSLKPGENVAEILLDGKVVGAIFPDRTKPNGIKVVSVHMCDKEFWAGFSGEVIDDDGSDAYPPIPSVNIAFQPSPWSFDPDTGKVVKH